MTRVGYPSDLFPGPLGASLDLPDGWAPVPVASAAMACRKLDSAHSFAPNIIVRTSSRGIDHSLRTAIAELAAFVDVTRGAPIQGATVADAVAVAWLADGVIDPLPLLSAEFASGQLAQALTFAGDKRQAAKVQLVF